jgi:hypothetical protein
MKLRAPMVAVSGKNTPDVTSMVEQQMDFYRSFCPTILGPFKSFQAHFNAGDVKTVQLDLFWTGLIPVHSFSISEEKIIATCNAAFDRRGTLHGNYGLPVTIRSFFRNEVGG